MVDRVLSARSSPIAGLDVLVHRKARGILERQRRQESLPPSRVRANS
jgi:hypothetical protein